MRTFILLAEALSPLPPVLFHATPARNLDAIAREGLKASMKMWDSHHASGVYLGDEEAAQEYMRHTGQTGADEGDTSFVMLAIDTRQLDPGKLRADDWEIDFYWDDIEEMGYQEIDDIPWQVSLRLTGQVLYDGDIPPSAISVHDRVG